MNFLFRRCEKESRKGTTTKQSRNSNPDGSLRRASRRRRIWIARPDEFRSDGLRSKTPHNADVCGASLARKDGSIM